MQLSHLSGWLFCFQNLALAAKWQQIFALPLSRAPFEIDVPLLLVTRSLKKSSYGKLLY